MSKCYKLLKMQKSEIKAIGFTELGGPDILKLVKIPVPTSSPTDLLVEVKAVGVNPVDTKLRTGTRGTPPDEEHPRVVGFDVSGIIQGKGTDVKGFEVGDEVVYGSGIVRQGAYTNLHAVDYRAVVKKPSKISWTDAAGFPLTFLTSWECLTERMHISEDPEKNKGKTILITAGAGGCGSIAIQIAKKILGLTVIATASRSETIEFVKKCGADHVINHRNAFVDELAKIGFREVDYIFHCWELTNDYAKQLVDVIRPLGTVGLLTAKEPIVLAPFFAKSINLALEMMAAKQNLSIEIESQGKSLKKGIQWLEDGIFFSTVTSVKPLTLENIKYAHEQLEKGDVIGKLVFDHIYEFSNSQDFVF